MKILARPVAALLLSAVCLWADFSYTEQIKMTGGSMAGAMKFAGKMGGANLNDMRAQVYVSGDKMARIDERTASITDLSAETITNVNFKRQEYSVITFAQMKQALEQAQAKMREQMAKSKKKRDAPDVQLEWDVEVKDPGRTAVVGGYSAKEMILLVTADINDAGSGTAGVMNLATNIWLSKDVAGYAELNDFHRRMAAKLDWTPSSNMLSAMGQGMQSGESMAKMQEQMAKFDGTPVKQVMRLGGTATGLESVAVQDQEKVAEANQQSSVKQGLKGLGGALGGFGGFGRKKKNKEPKPQAAGDGAMKASQAGVLMEMTVEYSAFSTSAVPGDKLAVPVGFKQVESRTLKQLK